MESRPDGRRRGRRSRPRWVLVRQPPERTQCRSLPEAGAVPKPLAAGAVRRLANFRRSRCGNPVRLGRELAASWSAAGPAVRRRGPAGPVPRAGSLPAPRGATRLATGTEALADTGRADPRPECLARHRLRTVPRRHGAEEPLPSRPPARRTPSPRRPESQRRALAGSAAGCRPAVAGPGTDGERGSRGWAGKVGCLGAGRECGLAGLGREGRVAGRQVGGGGGQGGAAGVEGGAGDSLGVGRAAGRAAGASSEVLGTRCG